MKKLYIRFLLINGILLILSVLLSLFYLFVKSHGITAFDCAFLRAFGFPCPSCGATRAVLALLTLRFLDAMHLSPGVCVCFFLLVLYDVLAVLAMLRRRPELERCFSPKLLILVPLTFLISFVARTALLFLA